MQRRFKGQAGTGGRGKNQARTNTPKKNRTSKRTGIAPGSRTKPATKARGNQKRNQKEWAAEKQMTART
jgi:hypothetical protein